MKHKQDAAINPSLCHAIDLNDALLIDWTYERGLHTEFKHHFDDYEDYCDLDYYEKVNLLCGQFTPSELRPVLQGIWTDAGRDWRSLKLWKARYRYKINLAPVFAKVCVDIINAKADLLEIGHRNVPQKIIMEKENVEQNENS